MERGVLSFALEIENKVVATQLASRPEERGQSEKQQGRREQPGLGKAAQQGSEQGFATFAPEMGCTMDGEHFQRLIL